MALLVVKLVGGETTGWNEMEEPGVGKGTRRRCAEEHLECDIYIDGMREIYISKWSFYVMMAGMQTKVDTSVKQLIV